MTARKLSDSEKQEILSLYRTTGETSSSLATRYGVSTSTVSRLLKSSLPADEYEVLIQQKRSMRSVDTTSDDAGSQAASEIVVAESDDVQVATLDSIEPEPLVEEAPLPTPALAEAEVSSGKSKPILRRKPRSSDLAEPEVEQLEVPLAGLEPAQGQEVRADASVAEAEVLKEILSQSVIEPDEEDLSDDLDDDLDDEEDEDDDFDEDGDQSFFVSGRLKEGFTVQILPLEEAPIPRTCYLVVDRAAELVAPPLRDFGDLGQIPAEEVQAKTLPIFDNHRIAKRYSNPRTQRVIKLPDGRILSKTSSHLRAKGITRLLIDGRVYSLT